MERHKRIGMITMVMALALAASAITFSSNHCNREAPLATVFLSCIRIDLPDFMSFSEGVHTKYALLVSALLLCLGFLWSEQALPVPGTAKASAKSDPSSSAADDA